MPAAVRLFSAGGRGNRRGDIRRDGRGGCRSAAFVDAGEIVDESARRDSRHASVRYPHWGSRLVPVDVKHRVRKSSLLRYSNACVTIHRDRRSRISCG